MKTRIIACALIYNEQNQILLCKMPKNRGVYPDQWGITGGGIEEGETIEAALRREIGEELGQKLMIDNIQPLTFRDDTRQKIKPDGSSEEVYMIYLIYQCIAKNTDIELNEEFEAYAWVSQDQLKNYDLNAATKITLQNCGFVDSLSST